MTVAANAPTAASTAPEATPPVTPIVLTAPNGLPGGIVGQGQGADQGEDQGENIAENGSGWATLGPTSVEAQNTMTSGAVDGGAGGDVTIVVDNYVETSCVTGITTAGVPTEGITARAGDGGVGGQSGTGQGTDQGEDQGENIGEFATGGSIGSTSSTATNDITSGTARGGAGGSVSITYSHHTDCLAGATGFAAPSPSSSVHRDGVGDIVASYVANVTCGSLPAPFLFTAGNGGAGGWSGREQGTDQGEDQDENIARFATGSTLSGPTNVTGTN